jgi:hypothetical protein
LASGWIAYAYWSNETGSPITFQTSWRVPPVPSTQNGQVIFLFNGIQNSTMIYQPVLQWGPSAAGGGNYWSVACWYADGKDGHSFYSSLTRVAVDQVLTGVMTQSGESGGLFSYDCVFQGIPNSDLRIQNVEELTQCVETLECYGLTRFSDYPAAGTTQMTGIEIVTTGGHPPLSWVPVNAATDCGQHTIVVSNSNPGGEVDLYYNNNAHYVAGQLLSYGDSGTPGNVSDPVVVGFGGWLQFKFLFAGRNEAGPDRIYAVNNEGQLLSYGDSGTAGNVSDPVVVGFGGWLQFKFLFAGRNEAGQDHIYGAFA